MKTIPAPPREPKTENAAGVAAWFLDRMAAAIGQGAKTLCTYCAAGDGDHYDDCEREDRPFAENDPAVVCENVPLEGGTLWAGQLGRIFASSPDGIVGFEWADGGVMHSIAFRASKLRRP